MALISFKPKTFNSYDDLPLDVSFYISFIKNSYIITATMFTPMHREYNFLGYGIIKSFVDYNYYYHK